MKIKLLVVAVVVFSGLGGADASRCMAPIKPILPIKPMWCQGHWTQILECDQRCSCEWKPTCIER